jgi:hypothetical protein
MAAGSRRWHFGLAVATLAVSAAGLQLVQALGWVTLIKKPLPIRKPLVDFGRGTFEPQALKFASSERLPTETLEELGTEEYINWELDYTGPRPRWRGPVLLSVTYYTGKPDQIPHVPGECLWQGGLSPAGKDAQLHIQPDSPDGEIAVHRVSFYPRPADGTIIYDYYTICVNGEYYSDRTGVRMRMAKPGDTHLYYSKIEAMFRGVADEDLVEVDRQALELLERAAAELNRSHYPLKGWEKGGPPTGATNAGF